MKLDRAKLLAAMRADAEEELAQMEQGLIALETRHDAELVAEIFRLAHTLKGNASLVGLDQMAEVAHAMEELLDPIRKGQGACTTALTSVLLEGVDELRVLLRAGDVVSRLRA